MRHILFSPLAFVTACAIIICFVFGIAYILESAVASRPVRVDAPQRISPIYRVGDCLTPQSEPEAWRERIIWRIERVGRERYEIRYWDNREMEWSIMTWDDYFSQSDRNKRIPCPTE